jgi:DNA-binding response OmpR family regulator
MDKKRILIVDDEEDIRKTLKLMLGTKNYENSEAEDGPSCLEILELKKFDLIIVDVMMPVMSGWDLVTKILKKWPEYKNKILFLSVLEIADERKKELIKMGVVDYINKPFNVSELKAKINSALE